MSVRSTTTPGAAERILDAADRLLARFGYRKMTVEDLAREVGVGKGTIYLSFESKESIALSCIDRMVERLLARMRATAARSDPAAARLRAMLVERVMHRFDYASAHSSSLDDLLAVLRPRLLSRRAGYFKAEAELLAKVLVDGRRDGTLEVGDPHETAHGLVLATNALLPYSLSVYELGRRPEIERRAEHIAGLLLNGLLARGRARHTVRAARKRNHRT
jgi:AcrR family transcriptional regulator